MEITENIVYVGVNDHEIDLFEGQYQVPNGISYNSYVILDEKIAVMDTVDKEFGQQWLENVEGALQGRKPDYLVIQHMEPDHSASIPLFLEKYPDAQVVATQAAFKMMNQFFPPVTEGQQAMGAVGEAQGAGVAGETQSAVSVGEVQKPVSAGKAHTTASAGVAQSTGIGGIENRQIIAANGGELMLGTHKLQFVYAPMVHWPEVMMTYEATEGILFSADGFGKFGALDVEEEWAGEARRYYIGIVGKYGAQVQNVLKKAAGLDIRMICPLHGPVLKENLAYYIGLYDTWSSYRPESDGVTVAYASIYGNTKQAALYLADELRGKGVAVSTYDLARDDMAAAVADAFRYGKLVLACNTYNAGINPFMHDFIVRLVEHNYQNRTVGLIENGSWAPMAAKTMRAMLEKSKEITFAEHTVTLMSAMKQEDKAQLAALADELAQ